jgi:hypothetical protein
VVAFVGAQPSAESSRRATARPPAQVAAAVTTTTPELGPTRPPTPQPPPRRPVTQPPLVSTAPRPVPAAAVAARRQPPPVAIVIPSIGVASPLERLELGSDGRIAAPVDFANAGWYAAGPRPGELGPAVLAGHLDSPTGAAVFTRLPELAAGAPVVVQRADGSNAHFTVVGVDRYAKDAFPPDVFGPVPAPVLRLVTCGGDFDDSSGHYVDNVVVSAVATASDAPAP